jgi:hypothetical protein
MDDIKKSEKIEKKEINLYYPTKAHRTQTVVKDDPARFKILVAGRKWRKTSLIVSELFKGAMTTPLEYPYIGPSKVMAENMIWNDHVPRLLNHFKNIGYPYTQKDENLTVHFPVSGGTFKIYGVDSKDSLRGMSTWGGVGCFIAGTKVETEKGIKNIEDIETYEGVKIPNGIGYLRRSGITKRTKELIEITLSTGEKVTCTPNHKIFTNNGLVSADELRYNDVVWTNKYHQRFPLMEQYIGYRTANTKDIFVHESGNGQGISIILYGKRKADRFHLGISFTTLMATNLTIPWKILQYLKQRNIMNIILALGIDLTGKSYSKEQEQIFQNLWYGAKAEKAKKMQEKISELLKYLQKYGMEVQKDLNGIVNEEKKTGGTWFGLRSHVNFVKTNTKLYIQKGLNTVPIVVGIRRIILQKETPVYNLEVTKHHCYFANGILVSNCDEYQDWAEDIWGLIIRPNLSVHRAWAYISGTPKGLNILYDMFQRGNMNSKTKMKDFKSFKYTSYDNPDLSVDELESMKLEYLAQGGEDYFRQEMMAEFIKARGAVYKEWDFSKRFIDFKYEPNLPLHVSFDFGVNDPTVIIWIQIYGSEIRIIDYYEATDANIEHYISVLNAKPYKKPELYTGDVAGYQRTLTTGTSPIEILNSKGIFLRTKTGVRIEDQIRATHTIMSRLYVKNTLNRVRDCLMNYRYPEDKNLIKGNEIPVHDQYSHAMRALEYWVINFANIIGITTNTETPSWVGSGGRKNIYG